MRRTLVILVVALGCCGSWVANAPAATYLVTNTQSTGPGSLNAAITAANATPLVADTIKFAIPFNAYPGYGFRTISLTTPLPEITSPVTIDGTTEPGYALVGTPLIRVDGGGSLNDGFIVAAAHSKILGLSITRFQVEGIELVNGAGPSGHSVVAGNWIGLDQSGTPAGNGVGIVAYSSSNLIGGTSAATRNVISGNRVGVDLNDAARNVVSGNYIGLRVDGLNAAGNTADGVVIEDGATANTIGGTSPAARNVISGNTNAGGVLIKDPGTNGNVVEGNYVGTDATGALPAANLSGVTVYAATKNTIGGASIGARNVISGNTQWGAALSSNATGNVVAGNAIGTSVDGTTALPNAAGVQVFASPNNTIGGATAAAGNVISGNTQDGVEIFSAASTGDVVAANLIGLTKSGFPLPNKCTGVRVFQAQSDTIGGTTPGARNVVSGNGSIPCAIHGAVDLQGATSITVAGNYIGTNLSGTAALGNVGAGVALESGSQNNIIGGTTAGARNVISGNGVGGFRGSGVLITDTSTTGNVVEGNYLGTNAAGTSAVPNAEAGVSLYPAASGNVVGGLVAGARNVISGNRDDGIDLFGPNNLIEGNYIGTNAAGSAAVPNVCDGIAAYTTISHDNLIGGTVPGARNIISGNGIPGGCGGVAFGIEIRDAVNTQVAGNYIGTSPSGGAAMGNLGGGVALDGGSHSITIGGVTPAERNVISGNRDDGVDILDTAYGNSVLGNFIGTTAIGGPLGNVNFGVYVASTGSSNLIGEPVGTGGNVIAFNGATTAADGVRIDGLNAHVSVRASNIYSNGGLGILLADDANGVQAAPQITEVKTTATSTTIDYTLASNANRTYDVDFFANAACDASGAGEGQKYLGSKTTVTDGVGNATDEVVFPTPLGALKIVTATATDESTHDTSQFSDCAKP